MLAVLLYLIVLAPVGALLWAIHPALVLLLVVAFAADVAWRVLKSSAPPAS